MFRILWPEPARSTDIFRGLRIMPKGSRGTSTPSNPIICKFRMFVVVRSRDAHCHAVAINSYGYQGVAKLGSTRHQQPTVFTAKWPTELHPAEMPGPASANEATPIRVVTDHFDDKLEPTSSTDFSRIHTVEHTVKGESFGRVAMASLDALQEQFNAASGRVDYVPSPGP